MSNGNPHDTPEDAQEVADRLNEIYGPGSYVVRPWTDPVTGERKYNVIKAN